MADHRASTGGGGGEGGRRGQTYYALNRLPVSIRLGLTGLIFVLLGGLAASGLYMQHHYANRDQRPDLTMTDIIGAYHGVEQPSELRAALAAGHPDDLGPDHALPDGDRQVLLDWLDSDRVSSDYDSLELGDAAPAEIIATYCLQCHSRNATIADEALRDDTLYLDYWDDVNAVAFSRNIDPTPVEILLISTHTHALALGTMGVMLIGLLLGVTRGRMLARFFGFLIGFGLCLDIASWWLARLDPMWVYTIVAGGAMFAASSGLACLHVLVDMWLPGGRQHAKRD